MEVLVADDDSITRNILSSTLTKEKFEPVMAEDGAVALEILKQNNSPKIAIIDWQMPKLTGIEVLQEIRSLKNSYIYCILLTARSEAEDFKAGFNAGADDFLTKPIDTLLIKQKLNVAKRIIQYEINEKQMQSELLNYANSMKALAEERAKQLCHADRLATLGTLAAGVAHEINNPTTFISGNVQSLEKYWEVLIQKGCFIDPEDKQISLILEHFPKIISGIRSGVKRISKIVSSLKSYARQDVLTKEKNFDVKAVIDEALELCYNKVKFINVEKNVPENNVFAFGDQYQIEQVIVNLLTNAVDAMNVKENPKIVISCKQKDNIIQVEIKDNGPGIKEEIIHKIFDPFFTSKSINESTGLGLSISKSIIDKHSGHLDVQNHPDGGAVFTFSIPMAVENS